MALLSSLRWPRARQDSVTLTTAVAASPPMTSRTYATIAACPEKVTHREGAGDGDCGDNRRSWR